MSEDSEYIITGYQATYILLDKSTVFESFAAANLKEAAEYILQEISRDNRGSVRMIENRNDEVILLPVASILSCYVRPRYKEEGDGAGGKRRVKKSDMKTPD